MNEKFRFRPFVLFFISLIAILFASQASVVGAVYSNEESSTVDQWSNQSANAAASAYTVPLKDVDSQDPLSRAGSTPNLIAIGHIGGAAYAVAERDNYVYLGQGSSMIIFDTSNPAKPMVVGKTEPLAGMVKAITIQGEYAFIAAGRSGLRIIDISDPAFPFEAGFLDTAGDAGDVSVDGDFAYIAESFQTPDDGGLAVVDISNPLIPVEAGFVISGDPSQRVSVYGSYAYLLGGGGLHIIDISDPTAPVEVGFYQTMSSTKVRGLDIAGTHAYVASWERLEIIDVTDVENPTMSGILHEYWGDGWSLKVLGNYAYVVADFELLHIVDISNPAKPAKVSDLPMRGWQLQDLALAGNYAYVATGNDGGLIIIDVSSTATPFEVGRFESPLKEAVALAVIEDTAYLADYESGLRIIDIANPATPIMTAFHEISRRTYNLDVTGDYAYVVRSYGLDIIDVQDPSKPEETGHFEISEFPNGVTVDSGLAYVAESRLRIIDVTDPRFPAEVGFFYTGAFDVAKNSDYAYVAVRGLETGILRIINVADPAAPTEIGNINTPGPAFGVAVDGNYAFVAAYLAGLRIIDVANPSAPVEVGFYDTPGRARAVAVAENHAFLADTHAGLRMINIANSAKPVEVGYYETAGEAWDVAVAGNYVYVADKAGGLLILQYSAPSDPPTADFSASPTSGAPPLTVEFTNLSTGEYDECIWDFDNDQVKTLCDGPLTTYRSAGNFTVSLTVKGPGGEDSITKTDYITVYAPPTADFSASPTSGPPPLTVEFTNRSTGVYDECTWDFGNGQVKTLCNKPATKYRNEGSFTVTLSVKGPGGEDTKTIEQYIKVGAYRIFLPGVLMMSE